MTGTILKGKIALLMAASSLAVGVATSFVPTATFAHSVQQQTYQFNISAKPIRQAMNDIVRETGVNVVFPETALASKVGIPVNGRMTASQAVETLLGGSGLRHTFANGNTVTIIDQASGDGSGFIDENSTVLNPIVVQGQSSTSEGTGSYRADAVTIGKMGQSIREIPNTVTVVTRQQIEDQDLNSVQEVVGATNGATLIQNDDTNERTEFQFRGFTANSLQVDGSSMSSNNDVSTFDTAIYDRVEVLKGPAGILQGAREPGGTINLVRKQPTSERQIKLDSAVGSWDRRRFDADISGSLTEDGAVRGRLVGAWDKGNSFIDLVNYDRRLLYGALDIDVTDNTTLTLGAAWQNGEGRNSRGLPAYADGTLLDVPRSTYAGSDWDWSETRSTDVFAKLKHDFDGGAVLNINANYLDRSRDGKIAFSNAPVDPVTGLTDLLPEHRIDRDSNFNFDTSLSVPFDVAGLEQKVLVGADFRNAREEMDRARGSEVPFDIFDPDYGIPEPDWNFNRFEAVKSREYGLYGQAQIKPLDWGKIIVGGRVSWWETRAFNRASGAQTSEASVDAEFTPYVAGVIDLNETTSVYVSYASIFVPQDAVTSDNEVLDPREGEQYEVGIKTELLDGAMNASLSLFQIDDRNRAVTDPADDDFSVAAGSARSRGFEAELSGEVLPSWEVTAGYTYLTTKYIDDPDNPGAVFEPRAPRHSFRMWNKYTVDEGVFEGLSVGGGIRVTSDVYRIDEGARFSQAGYALVDLQLGYQFNEKLRASLTVSNLFDRTYYKSVGYGERQNYYGEPRAVTFKLSSTF